MKNKTDGRSLPVLAIAAIVVTIVAVAVAATVLLQGGGGPSGLPIYPRSQSQEIPSYIFADELATGMEIAGYSVSDVNAQDVLNWYKDQMTGWTLEIDEVGTGRLIYKRGDDGAAMAAVSETGGISCTYYILVTAPWSTVVEVFGDGDR